MPRPNGNLKKEDLRKLRHKCTICGRTDAYTLNGRAACAECAQNERVRSREKHLKYKERINRKRRELYAQRRADGICTRCGKRTAGNGNLMCDICAAAHKKRQKKDAHRKGTMSREEARDLGICIRCMKAEARPGYSLCADCGEWWESVRNKNRVENEFTQGIDAYWAERKGGGTNGEV